MKQDLRHRERENLTEQGVETELINPIENLSSVKNSDTSGNAGASTFVTEGDEVLIKKRRKRKRRKKKPAIKALMIILCIIIALVLAVFGLYWHGMVSVQAQSGSVGAITKETIKYNGTEYVFNDNMKTVLLIGHDDESDTSKGKRPNEADMVAAAAIDVETGKVTIIGISRDTSCLVDQYSEDEFVGTIKEQLCMAYGYRSTPEAGSENVVKSAQSILYDIPIKYYYTLDEAAIAELNDAIGGVELVPLQTIPRTNIVEGEKTVLLGKEAHDYVQWRDTSQLQSSKDRQERELQYLKAFSQQAFGDSNGIVRKMTDLVSIVSEYSVTNISPSEMFYLANVIAKGDLNDIDIVMLDGSMVQNGQYAEFEIDENSAYKTILDTYYVKVS